MSKGPVFEIPGPRRMVYQPYPTQEERELADAVYKRRHEVGIKHVLTFLDKRLQKLKDDLVSVSPDLVQELQAAAREVMRIKDAFTSEPISLEQETRRGPSSSQDAS